MKIAIGTNDKQTINAGHFGESRRFCVVEVLMAKVRQVECRDNPWWNLEVGQRASKIAALLRDCDTLVIRSIVKQGLDFLSQKFRQVFLTSLTSLEEISARFSQGDMAGFKKYNPATQKFEACAE